MKASVYVFVFGSVSAHLIFSDKSVYTGGKPLTDLEKPMVVNTPLDDWYCKGYPRQNDTPTLELVSGGTISVPIICGEASIGANTESATQTCEIDFSKGRDSLHGEGNGENAGCAISIKIGFQDYVMLTVAHDCPKNDWSAVTFVIPEGLPSISDAECSWSWRPSENFAQPESYMNCFRCSIKGNNTGTITGGTRLIPNPDFTYKSKFPDGPVSGIVISNTTESTTATESTTVTKSVTTQDTTTQDTTTTTESTTETSTHVQVGRCK
jgi:hypothetical protein